jgi:hypothetical protein
MLKPCLLKNQHGIRAQVLKNTFHKQLSSIFSLLQKPYDPPRVSKNFVRPTFMRGFITWHLDVGDKKSIGVYSLLQSHLQKVSDFNSKHFDFLALGFLGFR